MRTSLPESDQLSCIGNLREPAALGRLSRDGTTGAEHYGAGSALRIYSITSSARVRSDLEIESPRARAVFMLRSRR